MPILVGISLSPSFQTMSLRLSQLRVSLPKSPPSSTGTEGPATPGGAPGRASGRRRGSPPSSNSSAREEMVLFVKIFFIMGLSFSTEVLHIALHGDHGGMKRCSLALEVVGIDKVAWSLSSPPPSPSLTFSTSPKIFLRLIGIVNMLRGFFIFVIFVCKRPIWKALAAEHPK